MLVSQVIKISIPSFLVLVVASASVVVGVAWTSDVAFVQRSIAARLAETEVARMFGVLTDLRRDSGPYIVQQVQLESQRDFLFEGVSATDWPIPLSSELQVQRARVRLVDRYVVACRKFYEADLLDTSEQRWSATITSIESGIPFRAYRRSLGLLISEEEGAVRSIQLDYGALRITRNTFLPTNIIWQGFFLNVLVYFFVLYLSALILVRHRFRRRIRNGLCPHCRYVILPECGGCAECGWMKS